MGHWARSGGLGLGLMYNAANNEAGDRTPSGVYCGGRPFGRDTFVEGGAAISQSWRRSGRGLSGVAPRMIIRESRQASMSP